MGPSIKIEVTPDGEVKALVEGVEGPICGELSAFLDDLGDVTHDEPTPDFYLTASQRDSLSTGW